MFRSAIRLVLRGPASISVTLVLTIGFLFLVLVKIGFREVVQDNLTPLLVAQMVIISCFFLEIGVQCLSKGRVSGK